MSYNYRQCLHAKTATFFFTPGANGQVNAACCTMHIL